MNICALRLIIEEHGPVDFNFHMVFLVAEMLNQRQLIKYA